MTVDGSAFGKPQIGPAYVHHKKHSSKLLSRMYLQEHFAPVVKTKVLQLAASSDQMIHFINNALENGKVERDETEDALKPIITFCDGKSTERVAGVIKNFLVKQ